MALNRKLLTSKGQVIDIATEDNAAIAHFVNPHNYADVVLNQINHDRFYNDFLGDAEDLVILDIGGNIGLFTLYAQDRAKAIYPVEPTPGHFHILKELTKDYPQVHPLNYAVHGEDTTIDFYISEENSTMNSSVNQYGTKVAVNARTIGTIIKELNLDHVDFVKCDIEGSEMAALTDETVGAVKDIVDFWFIEVHATQQETEMPWEQSLQVNREKLAALFTRQGYTVAMFRHDGIVAFKEEEE